jgi:hypothetical protein
MYSQGTNKKEATFPHTIPLPEISSQGDEHNHYSTFSSKGINPSLAGGPTFHPQHFFQ